MLLRVLEPPRCMPLCFRPKRRHWLNNNNNNTNTNMNFSRGSKMIYRSNSCNSCNSCSSNYWSNRRHQNKATKSSQVPCAQFYRDVWFFLRMTYTFPRHLFCLY